MCRKGQVSAAGSWLCQCKKQASLFCTFSLGITSTPGHTGHNSFSNSRNSKFLSSRKTERLRVIVPGFLEGPSHTAAFSNISFSAWRTEVSISARWALWLLDTTGAVTWAKRSTSVPERLTNSFFNTTENHNAGPSRVFLGCPPCYPVNHCWRLG